MATQRKTLPDGSTVFWDDANPLEQSRNGTAPNYLASVSHDGGKTWSQDPNQDPNWASKPDTLENFVLSHAPAQTLGDTLTTLAKAAPAMIGGPALAGGFGDTGAFGFNGGDSGGIPIPGSEFDPGTVYGEGTQTAGIPPAFGQTATDTVTSSAPGTSAGLPNWLKSASDVGRALSAASAGRAQGRLLEGSANQAQNRAAVDLYGTELNAPRSIARNAVQGDILSRAQDANISAPSDIPVPTISGGLRPSMFSPTTRQIGSNITAAAGRTPIPTPTPPVLPPLPQAGTLDSVLNSASAVSNIAGAVPWDKIPWGKIAGIFG